MSNASATGMRAWRQALPPQTWLMGAGYLAVYLLLDWASYVEPLRHSSITPWNPNTGVMVALLLRFGWRWWPLAAVGIFVGELLTDEVPAPWTVLGGSSLYLTAAYTLATAVLDRHGSGRSIESPRQAARFAIMTTAGSGLAACGYVALMTTAGQPTGGDVWTSIAHYWIGDFSGILAVTPVLLPKFDRAVWQEIRRKRRELVLQGLAVVIAVALVFVLAIGRDRHRFHLLFAPVAWVAMRQGVAGAMVSFCLIQVSVVTALEVSTAPISLYEVQFSLLTLGLTALFLGALATERDTALRQMRDQDAVLQRSLRFAVAGQLASALTHELNQPMTALLSYVRSSEIMSEAQPGADPRLTGTLRKAGQEAVRAADVLRRLRDFYRGQGARLAPTDALAVCARVAEALRDRMRRNLVEFSLHDPGGLPRVMVDRTQLEIVIHNLLVNSLDAFVSLPAGHGQARRIEVTGQARDADVLIAVDDSGPGIAPAVSERLFEPFVTNKMTGMGLGLSLSRTFLRHQGGDLWTEPSRLGGARFVIRLATQATPQTSL